MVAGNEPPITEWLQSMRGGDEAAGEALFRAVYLQLRQIAQQHLAGERAALSIAPTELVHEAYLKLCAGQLPDFADRAHFFAVGARAMRQVLVDRARRRNAIKRDAGERVTLITDLPAPAGGLDVLALDQALTAFAAIDARKARAIELRLFAGLSFDEIAALQGVSRATLARDYRAAEAWLFDAMHRADSAPDSP